MEYLAFGLGIVTCLVIILMIVLTVMVFKLWGRVKRIDEDLNAFGRDYSAEIERIRGEYQKEDADLGRDAQKEIADLRRDVTDKYNCAVGSADSFSKDALDKAKSYTDSRIDKVIQRPGFNMSQGADTPF